MKSVTSRDGTTIGFSVTGTGPPLVLVHGGMGDRTRWDPLIEHLDDHFTVYAMDRRGRGLSGDGDDYSLRREVEDVIAVATSISGQINLYGVSSGAVYALEAAPEISNLHKLVLYEPAIANGVEITPSDVVDKLQQLIDEGKPEKAIETLLRDIVGLTPDEINHYRSQPSWPARVACAHTIPREEHTSNDYRFDPDRFSDFQVSTLLLEGSESPAFLKESVEKVHSILRNSHVLILEGQGHAADIVAPQMVADALIQFLSEGRTPV